MKHASEILLQLEAKGVDVFVEEETLKARGRRGTLDAEVVSLIKSNRSQLLEYLRLNSDSGAAKRGPVVAIRRDSNRLPPSFAQQRLWSVDRLEGGSAHYNMPSALRVTGRFDAAAAEQAFQRIIARHEPLRTVFGSDGAEVWQEIRPSVAFTITQFDVSHLPHEEREERVGELARSDAGKPFDLAKDVMLRVSWIRCAPEVGILLFNMHHIASDGWSMGILVREFIAQYAAVRSGGGNPLPPLGIQYADYAQWQRDWLTGEVLEQQLGYWERQLAGLPPVHNLPLSRPRPMRASFKGARYEFIIDEATHGGLERLAQERQATLFMMLHAALGILLSRHSNSTDIVIGVPVANRPLDELEGIIGFFVNTLVLRADCSGNPSFIDYLERIKTVHRGAQSHQDIPFEYLVERLKPERSTQFSPLFQILFSMRVTGEERGGSIKLEDVQFTPETSAEVGVKYDLLIDAHADGTTFHIDYDIDLFDAAVITRLAQHFAILLQGIVADPRMPIHALPLLSRLEQSYLLHSLNATQASFPEDQCIHELFEEQAAKTPDNTAVFYEGKRLTYAGLNEQANQLARYLREEGVKADTLVGLCVERGIDMIVGLLGILKSGGAYVPLDPGYPRERLARMIEDSALQLLVTQEALLEKARQAAKGQAALRILSLDDMQLQSKLGSHSAQNPGRQADQSAHNLAYVIYTSGSTGQPKGVMVEHRGLANLALCQRTLFAATGQSRALCFASLSFDAATFEWLLALLAGATAYVCSEEQRQNPAALEAYLVAQRITHATLPPAVLYHLNSDRSYSLVSLILAGEACSEPLVRPWVEKYKVFNAYGPTEGTIWSSAVQLDLNRAITIGRPIANTRFYVLDGHLNPVPTGVPGELYIGGVGVARGYLNRAQLTAQRFVVDPFVTDADTRMYRTGDWVRYLPDGNLEFIGRNDDQVKVRGFRIELGEIEAALLQHAQVRHAAVLLREDSPGEKHLVAYVAGAEGSAVQAGDLRAHLAQSLPEHMVPADYVLLESLPLTSNGKIDRKSLPPPDARVRQIEYVAPATPTERMLVEIWAELLRMEPGEISAAANFFALGGHSLLVVRLLPLLRQRGWTTDVRIIFSAPDLRALAAELDETRHGSFSAPVNLIPPGCDHIEPRMLPLVSLSQEEIERIVATVPGGAPNVQDIYPLAPLQEGILFLHLLRQKNDPYVLRGLFSMESRVRFGALVDALQRVIDRHDVLRTAVVSEDISRPVQVVYRHARLQVETVELDPVQDALGQVNAWFNEPRIMEIARAPLLRIRVARDPHSERCLFLLQLHHIVADHAGLEIVRQELDVYLAGGVEQLAAPASYRDFVAHALDEARHVDAPAFFRETLGDVTEPAAPFNLLDVHGDGTEIVEAGKGLHPELAKRIRQTARHHKLTPAVLFHTAWAMVVAACSGKSDVVFGTVLAGRSQGTTGMQHMLGVFINTLPLRLRLDGMSVVRMVEQVDSALRELLPYEQVPLSIAQRCSGLARNASLFTALFNYRHSHRSTSQSVVDGVTLIRAQERTNYPLVASIDDFGEEFSIDVQVHRSVAPVRVIGYLEEALTGIVSALQEQPDRAVLSILVLPAVERQPQSSGEMRSAGPTVVAASRPTRHEPLEVEYVAPQTQTERELVQIWAQLLQLQPREISTTANFFALGGHSLLVIRLASSMRQAGLNADVMTLHGAATLRALAAAVDDAGCADHSPFRAPANLIPLACDRLEPRMLPLVSLSQEEIQRIVATVPGGARNVQDIYPLAPLQEGILFSHLLHRNNDPYILPALFSVASQARFDEFVNALQWVIERHDVLRTAVVTENISRPMQVVYRHAELQVEALELDPAQDAMSRMEARFSAPQVMDVTRAPMLKISAARDPGSEKVYVLFRLHHLVSDHIGLEIIRRELGAFLTGGVEDLAVPVPYREFVARALNEARGSDAESFFRRTLGDVTEPTAPFNLADVRGDGTEIVEAGKTLDPELSRLIRQAARRHRVGPAILFHTAWAMVVAACSGRSDVVFGTVLSGRSQGTTDVQHMLGMFINTLPLRVRLDGTSIVQMVRQVESSLRELLPYEQVPLSTAQQYSGLAGGALLFSALLNYRHLERTASRFMDDGVTLIHARERTNYPFMASIDDLQEGFSIDVQVHSSVNPHRVIGYLEEALAAMVCALQEQPEKSVLSLSVLPASERQQLLRDWNPARTVPTPGKSIHELFEEQAAKTPNNTAVVCEGGQLTYAELNGKANKLAHYLRAAGVEADTLVGLCIERDLQMVVALLGILKAGGAYVPLDPGYPRDRLAYMIEDSGVQLLLTQTALEEKAGRLAGETADLRILSLDGAELQSTLHRCSANNPCRDVEQSPRNLAYVIYTSGSTGTPKGVMIEHQAVVNLLHSMQREPGIDPTDALLSVTSLSFDMAVTELYLPLTVGACTVLATREGARQPEYLLQAIERYGITVMQATPSTWRMLVDHVWPVQRRPLKAWFGGEAISDDLVRRTLRHVPAIWNLYGPTETTVYSTAHCIAPGQPKPLIGRPLANMQAHVLDRQCNPVPIGVAGELHIGGAGVARGYLNRPELTAERFIVNPFHDPNNPASSARLYKTGDLVRYLADGTLEYLDRIDDQVKIRGFRIELGEIERQLARYPDVSSVVVVAREGVSDQKMLVAYVTTPEERVEATQTLAARLEEHLRGILPEYMVPGRFMVLQGLPLTPNGKIDKKALPAPNAGLLQARYVAPRTPTEQVLAAIWADLLELKENEVGATDSFFALGGHSLTAVSMMSEVRKHLDTELSVKTIFATTTLSALAAVIDAGVREAQRPQVTALERRGDRLLPSFAQQRLWFLDRLDGGSAHYNMPSALRVRGRFDVAVAEQAFRRIIERHEPLRTVFVNDGAQVWQEIRARVDFSITQVDISHLDNEEQERLSRELARADAGKPFDLARDVMLRASFIRLGEQSGMLLFNMHHIASDGWSMGILVEEFTTQYEASRNGRGNPLPPLAIQYADYAQWQRNWLAGNVLESQLGYWQQQLLELPLVHHLPVSRPRPAQAGFKGARHEFSIDAATHQALTRLAQEQQATLFMVLHAALSILLSRHSDSTDIVIGTPVANRMQKELEDIIGFFVNTLVLRADCSGNPRFTDYLQRIKTVHLDAQSNQDIPFEYLVERLNPERSTQYSPLFQIAFGMGVSRGRKGESAGPADVQFNPVTSLEVGAKYELQFEARELAQGIAFLVEYNIDLFDTAAIVRMTEHLGILLQGIAADPHTPIGVLPLLSREEQHYLLHTLNATQVQFPQDKCIHEIFEDQAAATPGVTAMVYEGGQLTYAELNRKANQLAHYLREERNVDPDDLVGICIDRSPEMIVGILGVLKAGGAYVPLDPQYPPARLAYLLDDANTGTVLTKQHLLGNLPITDDLAVCLDDPDIQQRLDAKVVTNIEPRRIGLRSGHLAYVIYTSGSTGHPKGVMVEHASVVNLTLSTQARCGLVSEDGVLLFSTINSDPSVANIFSALCCGCRLILASENWLQSTQQFWACCLSSDATILDLPTAYWHELARDPRLAPARCVRRINIGGEKVNPAMVTEWHKKVSARISLANVYGPTETTVDATAAELFAGVSHIGKPIQNVSLYVLSQEGALAPAGAPGELYIGGAGLARGYLQRPSLTADRFVTNPYYDQDSPSSQRLYKTGDRVRYLPDGNLEYLGRADDQVKIRGFRVELGEIESQLAQNENVASAVVLAREDAPGEKRLVAYVTGRDRNRDHSDLVAKLRGYLEERLPQPMVPTLFVVMDEMPLMPNGKVEKRALPSDTGALESGCVAARTETEHLLVAIWSGLLRLEPREISTAADFFDLGGHSLLLIRLSSRIQEQFDIHLSAHKLFELTTIARIGDFIDGVLEMHQVNQHFHSMPGDGVTEVEI